MDFLKRPLAPITDKAWAEVQEQAVRSLRSHLSARKVVDVSGPKGLDFPAVGLGHLDVAECPMPAGEGRLCYGIHRALPLVEVRATFELGIWDLDDLERGAKDVDLRPVLSAARQAAAFEETAVYKGFAPAGIKGLSESRQNSAQPLGLDGARYPDRMVRALLTLKDKEIEGPYALVLGPRVFQALEGSASVYPPRKQMEQLLGGPVHLSPFIDGGFLISTRGGDLELTLGLDFSLGYESHDAKKVRFHLSESFTFRVLEPAAFVEFTLEG